MPNKMLIDASHPEETRVVVLRGNKVQEFDFEAADKKPLRGNIYLAKVTRVEPSLQAAFVDYGGNRHGSGLRGNSPGLLPDPSRGSDRAARRREPRPSAGRRRGAAAAVARPRPDARAVAASNCAEKRQRPDESVRRSSSGRGFRRGARAVSLGGRGRGFRRFAGRCDDCRIRIRARRRLGDRERARDCAD